MPETPSQRTKHSYAPEWSYQETRERLMGLEEGTLKDFAILAYVSGGRLNEVRYLRPKNISFKTMSDGSIRLIITIKVEKNPHMSMADVPMNPKNEPWYARHIIEWIETFDDNPDIMPFLSFSERYYQMNTRRFLDIHPHALRHLRVHHVDDNTIPGMKPLTPRQFKDFFRWHLIEVSAHYQSRTRTIDLAEKM